MREDKRWHGGRSRPPDHADRPQRLIALHLHFRAISKADNQEHCTTTCNQCLRTCKGSAIFSPSLLFSWITVVERGQKLEVPHPSPISELRSVLIDNDSR